MNQAAEKKIQQGIQLLDVEDLASVQLENEVVELLSETGTSLGMAYLSRENKGGGWLISEKVRPLDQAFFIQLFQRARQKRSRYEESGHTTAYRLFNQDGDFFGGLTIDRYGDYALFTWYNPFVYQLRQRIADAFFHVYPDVKGAYEKIRFQGVDYESGHLRGEEAPDQFLILENGVSYQVFLNDGLMTGIFLDQHETRGRLVDGLAAGKSVLNLFSYTAAFSVAASIGGATSTTSVDLAKRSKELSMAHFVANGLPLDPHRFVVMDVFDYYRYAKRHGLSYDLIILDPPSFARNKKRRFSVAKDFHILVAEAADLLNPEGILIASTNAANLPIHKFRKQIEKGLQGHAFQVLESDRLPADFSINSNDERSNYLKVITIKVNK
ncbi:LSU m5C1962 methyltransferase RlmI [Streptococcus sp. DD13]|nr:LSU m5C1962 methyltransferase RlmI [Streptococcus sp. DD13]